MSNTWRLSIGNSTFERLSNELGRYFARRLKGSTDPEDFVADVWLESRRYEGRGSLTYYLFIIARTKVADYWRRMGRRPPLTFANSDPPFEDLPALVSGVETMANRAALAEVVRECLAAVTPPFRDVVAMWLENVDPVQIAANLDIPYNTARSRLVRGRRQLEAAVRKRLGR